MPLLLLWIAGAGHLIHGNVDLHAMAWLLVGSIPGVLIGSHLSIRVPDRALRLAFAFILVLSGIKLVKVPAANTIILVGVVARRARAHRLGRRDPQDAPAPAQCARPRVESRGRGPRPADGSRHRPARGHRGRLRADRAREARAVADLRDPAAQVFSPDSKVPPKKLAHIRFHVRKSESIDVWIQDSDGKRVDDLLVHRAVRAERARSGRLGRVHPCRRRRARRHLSAVVKLERSHRTIVMPSDITVDTRRHGSLRVRAPSTRSSRRTATATETCSASPTS